MFVALPQSVLDDRQPMQIVHMSNVGCGHTYSVEFDAIEENVTMAMRDQRSELFQAVCCSISAGSIH
jgi:hypothetical protein